MDQVRILREARSWTQQHLADASGLSLRTVQRVELGEVTPSKETLSALAGALDTNIEGTRSSCVERFVWGTEGAPCVPSCRVAGVEGVELEGVELQHVPELGTLKVQVNDMVVRRSVDVRRASELSYEVQQGNLLFFAPGRVQDGDLVGVAYTPRLVVASGVP